MPLNFKKYAEKGDKFLKELAHNLGDDNNLEQAGRALQTTFKTLRSYLTIEENFQLMAQLPMALKSVYIMEWNPNSKAKIKKSKKGFMEEFMKNGGPSAWRDFSDLQEGEFALLSVLNTMRKYVSKGEFKDIEAVLPAQIKEIIRDSDFR
ncbi:MAG: DUF2267 domain-containing protein [Bacteroidota bacterium]|nr:DUF2267 domain-containing protein [Bacteroidota bacterium]